MMRRFFATLCLTPILLAFLCGCRREPSLTFRLSQKNDSLNALQLWRGDSLLDTWEIPHPILSLSQGDLTGDGIPEAALCVEKRTRHWQDVDRRPWIFKIEKGRYIRPLWLGSRLSHRLDSLCIKSGNVLSIENDDDGTFLVARYEQRGFGLSHREYILRHATRPEARQALEETP